MKKVRGTKKHKVGAAAAKKVCASVILHILFIYFTSNINEFFSFFSSNCATLRSSCITYLLMTL